jgi:metal-responsive CopG/Arc/MetJ family transcriptional regulator
MYRSNQLNRFGVPMEEVLKPFDQLCAQKGYATRFEAIRDMCGPNW